MTYNNSCILQIPSTGWVTGTSLDVDVNDVCIAECGLQLWNKVNTYLLTYLLRDTTFVLGKVLPLQRTPDLDNTHSDHLCTNQKELHILRECRVEERIQWGGITNFYSNAHARCNDASKSHSYLACNQKSHCMNKAVHGCKGNEMEVPWYDWHSISIIAKKSAMCYSLRISISGNYEAV